MREAWIIGICNSGADGVILRRFFGTEDEVKGLLVRLVVEDAQKDVENYDSSTERKSDIYKDADGGLYAYGTYTEYHIDYSAKRISEIAFA